MAPTRSKAAKSKDPVGRFKSGSKGQKNKKKRKRGAKKSGRSSLFYTLFPKHKRLARIMVAKLKHETDEYMLARGVDAVKRLDHGKGEEEGNDAPAIELSLWRDKKKTGLEYKRWKDIKFARVMKRALLRRKRTNTKRQEELRRKFYRVHPQDAFHKYVPGYKKTRHRITKRRFMRCVDIPLFKEALNGNKDLMESPLWNEKLNFKNMSFEKANQLKDQLYQFEVLVESLKQGVFDIPGCDDFPLKKVRRKKKKVTSQPKIKLETKRKRRSSSSSRVKRLKRRLSFPPYEESKQDLLDVYGKQKEGVLKGALKSVANWLTSQQNPNKAVKVLSGPVKEESPNEDIAPPPEPTVQDTKENEKMSMITSASVLSQTFKWARKTSLKSFPPLLRKQSMAIANGDGDQGNDEHTPFADLLTIQVPTEPGQQKRFIRTLVDRKEKKTPKRTSAKTVTVETAKQEEDEARQRHERFEKSDPLQRLHQDEKDSDICTVTSTTTTDGYASWRRARDFRNAGNKQEILAHKVDTTVGWRVILLLIVLWEIGTFVKTHLDDIYYWIFTSHLYRENIWLFEPTLFPETEIYFMVRLQQWFHAIISVISLSIIHRENECVSLLFATSMLFDGVLDIGMSTHDYVYLPDPVDWLCVVLTGVQVIWKVFIICLFIGYHYYSSGYIRKAREFKHRKTKLHNHEIKAKGTKGLQKRRMAWSWMTRHARDTNLKNLKAKHSDIKDGNFPEDMLATEIKFSETKELRLYTQKHNLNIGYPYNKLRDMKRYVFAKLEKSDYTDKDEMEENEIMRKKLSKMARRSSRAITLKKWQEWKDEKEQQAEERRSNFRLFSTSTVANPTEATRANPNFARTNLTIDPTYSHRKITRQLLR